MLRAHLVHCSRPLASSSSAPSACLHTSAVLQAAVSSRARKSQQTLKANVERREELESQAKANRPHVVLGHKAGDEAKWQNCDLARVLITAKDVSLPSQDSSEIAAPPSGFLNYGVGETEKEMLFDLLPSMTTQGRMEADMTRGKSAVRLQEDYEKISKEEMLKSTVFAKLVDLRNANARGIAYENRRRIVATFSEQENPTDTGRPEVQAALATMAIRNLWDHLSRCKKDIANRRSLRRLVHERAKILKYLKGVDEDRYDRILERLGLERSAVEGELVV